MGVGRLEGVHGKDARGITVTGIRIMSDDEILEVVQAHKEGKKIESRPLHLDQWFPILSLSSPTWNFAENDYRVAPEPRKPREWRLKFDEGSKEVKGITSAIDVGFAQNWILVREVLE